MIRERMKSFYRALSSGMNCTCSSPHEVTVSLDWAAHEAESRAVQIAISYAIQSPQSRQSSAWRKLQNPQFIPCRAKDRLWLEYMVFAPDIGDHEQRFVLSYAENLLGAARPLPLESLIASPLARERPFSALSVKYRYGIAAALCWSALHLTGSPWLGEGWNTWHAKVLSEGVEYGRDLMRNLVFDLGILLIELCLKIPLASLRMAHKDARLASPTTVPEDVSYTKRVDELVEEVRGEIGDSYGDAVERCVKFVFQGSESKRRFEVPEFRRIFYETVVAPVQATYQMMPETASYLPE
ncbi:hypothetical protein QBC40DRAFT_301140 [Triangularia verruculosa]|uniref:Uncharacterized protein n=1 Tax=Triangularia verruculosa TaxID=2587418 RepID=A0AAN7ANM6_9PEZI|nr:hypothetical protein QBC40DRAFT_301140 [Triangularia verruculosa]